jgi:hypothetical protein
VPDPDDSKRAQIGKAQTINESENALFSECIPKCAPKLLDTADIVIALGSLEEELQRC